MRQIVVRQAGTQQIDIALNLFVRETVDFPLRTRRGAATACEGKRLIEL